MATPEQIDRVARAEAERLRGELEAERFTRLQAGVELAKAKDERDAAQREVAWFEERVKALDEGLLDASCERNEARAELARLRRQPWIAPISQAVAEAVEVAQRNDAGPRAVGFDAVRAYLAAVARGAAGEGAK